MAKIEALLSALLSAPAHDEMEIAVLGRGFGEAVVLHAGDNNWIVIDCFLTEDETPAPIHYLGRMGVSPERIQLILATHWHDDHVRGLASLFESAKNAELAFSAAFEHDEFLAFLGDSKVAESRPFTRGVQELAGVLEVYKKGGRTIAAASASSILYSKRPNETSFELSVQLISLSPSPSDVIAFLRELPASTSEHAVRMAAPSRNWASVATWFAFGDRSSLLGADLLQTAAESSGWKAVVSRSHRPTDRAQLFKVPHHGSRSGHSDEVWKNILVPRVTSALAPWSYGGGLPQPSDINRIKRSAGDLYTALDRSTVAFRGPRQVANILSATSSKVTSFPRHYGFVSFRRQATDPEWRVALDGGARKL